MLGIAEDLLRPLDEGGFYQFIAAVFDNRCGTQWGGLQVKLQGNNPALVDEALIRTHRTGGDTLRTRRQVEGLTVPVKYVHLPWPQFSEWVVGKGLIQLDRKPADLLLWPGYYLSPQYLGDELGPETDPQYWFSGSDHLSDKPLLTLEPAVLVLIVNAHGATEYDQQVEALQWRELLLGIEAGGGKGVSASQCPGLYTAGTFKRDVLQDMDIHDAVVSCVDGSSFNHPLRSLRKGHTGWARFPHRRLSGSLCGMKKIILAALLSLFVVSCARAPQSESFELYVFGTLVTISVWDGEPSAVNAAVAEITRTFQQMHHDWHAWKPGPLVEINKAISEGRETPVPESIAELISHSQQLYLQSDGLFNPAIGGLLNLWGFQGDGRPSGPPPSSESIAHWVEASPGMDDLQLHDGLLSSSNPAVQLDFGAFAKGVAVDQAIAILRTHGLENAIVNGGGDLRVIGSKGEAPWRVGIRHPQGQGVLAALEVKGDESVFTSGNYERYREHEGVHYAHILDPRTGMPVVGITSVTVLHQNGGVADAAATALVVAGVKDWQRIAKQMGIAAVMLVDDVGTVYMSPAMQQRIQFTAEPPANIVISDPL